MSLEAFPHLSTDPAGSADPRAADYLALVARSRAALLQALEGSADVTFVRGIGNIGDQLIWAGTRELYRDRIDREIGVEELSGVRGHTALVSGGGAWCRSYHEVMPLVLALCEERFAQVVLLPSSFDTTVPEVRDALAGTRARVFAREPESLAGARELCPATLALDAAFFFDFGPWRELAGAGTLSALRTDREAAGVHPPPDGNVDISAACATLADWLSAIASHAEVVTDRAHVMIAAALMGKRVRYRPSNYHKLASIASFALSSFRVEREAFDGSIAERQIGGAPFATVLPPVALGLRERLGALAGPPRRAIPDGEPRVTVAVATRDRPELAGNLLRSLREHAGVPFRLLLIDNNSQVAARAVVAAAARSFAGARVVLADCNLGAAGARLLASGEVDTPYLLFLDDDAELLPNALARLVAALDAHPEAAAAGPSVILPTGRAQMCGGETRELGGGVLAFLPVAAGTEPEALASLPSDYRDWLGGMALLCRTAALCEPIDGAMRTYYEDVEWCYRVARGGGRFWFESSAFVLHHQEEKTVPTSGFHGTRYALAYLESIAHFYRRHGRILEGVFAFAPGLVEADGARRTGAARLLLELLVARGAAWVLSRWIEGDLASLFEDGSGERRAAAADGARLSAELQAAVDERRRLLSALGESALDAADLEARLTDARDELDKIYASRLWRLADLYWRLRRSVDRGRS